jgi:hypothetical protein
LFTDEPWTLRARTDDHEEPVLDNAEDSDISVPPPGLANEDVENHHGFYRNHDGVLEEPQNKIPFARGRLNPEYVNNFAMPLYSMMSISPLIYWKIIARQLNDTSQIKRDLQSQKNGKRTVYVAH